jgi:hypothetical protein
MDKISPALTPNEAHEMIGGSKVISRATWYAAINNHQVPHLRLSKRRIIIPRSAFLKWLETAGFRTPEALAGRNERAKI